MDFDFLFSLFSFPGRLTCLKKVSLFKGVDIICRHQPPTRGGLSLGFDGYRWYPSVPGAVSSYYHSALSTFPLYNAVNRIQCTYPNTLLASRTESPHQHANEAHTMPCTYKELSLANESSYKPPYPVDKATQSMKQRKSW